MCEPEIINTICCQYGVCSQIKQIKISCFVYEFDLVKTTIIYKPTRANNKSHNGVHKTSEITIYTFSGCNIVQEVAETICVSLYVSFDVRLCDKIQL